MVILLRNVGQVESAENGGVRQRRPPPRSSLEDHRYNPILRRLSWNWCTLYNKETIFLNKHWLAWYNAVPSRTPRWVAVASEWSQRLLAMPRNLKAPKGLESWSIQVMASVYIPTGFVSISLLCVAWNVHCEVNFKRSSVGNDPEKTQECRRRRIRRWTDGWRDSVTYNRELPPAAGNWLPIWLCILSRRIQRLFPFPHRPISIFLQQPTRGLLFLLQKLLLYVKPSVDRASVWQIV